MREESLTDNIFESHLPVTVQAVQIEEIEGRQYMTVLATDKDGFCVSSARGYALGKLTEEEFGCLGSYCKKCELDSSKRVFATPAFPNNPDYPGTVLRGESEAAFPSGPPFKRAGSFRCRGETHDHVHLNLGE